MAAQGRRISRTNAIAIGPPVKRLTGGLAWRGIIDRWTFITFIGTEASVTVRAMF
jgi:hypothetical protein